MALIVGQILNNRYRIVQPLDRSCIGVVYKAWDLNLDEPSTVKENLDGSEQASRHFGYEASHLYKLKHPNLPRVTDYFYIPNQGQYLVTEFIEGESLADSLARNRAPFPQEKVVPWISQVLDALEYLHSQQPPVIHCEVNPASIRIALDGRLVLVNLGLSKVFDPILIKTAGSMVTWQGFSPPEQYGLSDLDSRSDIYSVGATLYTLLTGVVLPSSVDIGSGISPRPNPAHKHNPVVFPAISGVIDKAFQYNRSDRFSSAIEMKTALSQAVKNGQPNLPLNDIPQLKFIVDLFQDLKKRWPIYGAAISFIAMMTCLILASSFIFMGFLRHGRGRVPVAAAPTITVPINPLPTLSTHPLIPTKPQVFSTSTPEIGSTRVSDIDGMTMVYVPAGEFLMGELVSNLNAFIFEKPQQTVYLDAFWIDQTEVTNEMYRLCVMDGVCQPPNKSRSFSRSRYYDLPQYADYPVIYVRWNDADNYCRWAGRRLPTEAEWEKAARGSEGAMYPWGQDPIDCNRANFWAYERKVNSGVVNILRKGCNNDTVRVGSFPGGVSPYGTLDMLGNVKEWVADWFDENYYQGATTSNPIGPESGEYHTIRDPFGFLEFQPKKSERRSADRRGGSEPSLGKTNVRGLLPIESSGSSVSFGESLFGGEENTKGDYKFVFVLRITYRKGGVANLVDYNLGFRCAVSP